MTHAVETNALGCRYVRVWALRDCSLTIPAGSVTAANASSINDGSSALVVMSAEKAKLLGIKPMARVLGYAAGGCAPEWVMMAPEKSIGACATKLGKKPSDFDLHEIKAPKVARDWLGEAFKEGAKVLR